MIKKAVLLLGISILVLSMTGCTQIKSFLTDYTGQLCHTWSRDGDSSYKIEFNTDNTGLALNKNTNDFLFDWRFDPKDEDTMIWEIHHSSEVRVVKFYFLGENNEILVLEWDGHPTVYSR